MIELKFEDKVKVWRNLREELETNPHPFDLITRFMSTLPVSSRKSNAFDPSAQIQPWHLLENSSFTEYEIAQLYAYTLQLTDRFCSSKVEIHISKDIEKEELLYLVFLDGSIVLGYNNKATSIDKLPKTIVSQKVIVMPPLH
jgi:hypothetical protein